ncbi:MAG: type II toxin-antitoxin system VapC family toxin [Leifsonia sp.]
MRWLLDTVAVSATRRPERTLAEVIRWLEAQNPFSLYVSAITMFELELGTRRKEVSDPVQGADLRACVERVSEAFVGRILSVDEQVAVRAASLHIPDPKPERDALMAATAYVHNLTVVTRNTRDFQTLDVRIHNPWMEG